MDLKIFPKSQIRRISPEREPQRFFNIKQEFLDVLSIRTVDGPEEIAMANTDLIRFLDRLFEFGSFRCKVCGGLEDVPRYGPSTGFLGGLEFVENQQSQSATSRNAERHSESVGQYSRPTYPVNPAV